MKLSKRAASRKEKNVINSIKIFFLLFWTRWLLLQNLIWKWQQFSFMFTRRVWRLQLAKRVTNISLCTMDTTGSCWNICLIYHYILLPFYIHVVYNFLYCIKFLLPVKFKFLEVHTHTQKKKQGIEWNFPWARFSASKTQLVRKDWMKCKGNEGRKKERVVGGRKKFWVQQVGVTKWSAGWGGGLSLQGWVMGGLVGCVQDVEDLYKRVRLKVPLRQSSSLSCKPKMVRHRGELWG